MIWENGLYRVEDMDVASTSVIAAVHRGQRQFRARAAQTDRREQVLDRVDQLVRGMEAIAERLS